MAVRVETVDAIAKLSTTTASDRATVATLTATNSTLTSSLKDCQLQLVEALRMSTNSLPSLPTSTKIPAQSHPTPEVGTTAGLMVTPRDIPAKTDKNLEPGMPRAQQKLIQKWAQLEINPAETGWELNKRKKLQTQQHPSPYFPTLSPSTILAAPAIF